jgi:adenylate cyclase
VASRLEALTKAFGCQLVVSESLARHVPGALSGFPQREVDVRGRAGRLTVRLVDDAGTLPGLDAEAERTRRPWHRARRYLRLPQAWPG